MKIATFALLLAAVLASGPVEAQTPIPVGTRVGDPPSGYDSGGRRDPFVSLVVPRRPATPNRTVNVPRRAGLAGLALRDANVRGVARHGDDMMAIVEGPDGQSFVVHVNDQLMDAEVKSIDLQGVVFVERLEGVTVDGAREVRKALRAGSEGVR